LDLSGGSSLFAGIGAGLGSVGSTAGDITINATGAIAITDSSRIASGVNFRAVGNSGNINIQSGRLLLNNESSLFATTSGQGNAANIFIRVNGPVELVNNSYIFSGVGFSGRGNIGDINLLADSLVLREGSRIVASTSGKGDAGNINIDVRGAVSLDGVSSDGFSSGAFSSVGTAGDGNGGDLNLQAGSLSVTNGAQVSASTFGRGNAGNLTLLARDSIQLIGTSADGQFASGLRSAVEPGGVGNGGNLTFQTRRLVVRDGAQVSTATLGRGNAGNLDFLASDSIELVGTSAGLRSAVEQGAVGDGGNINFTTSRLLVRDGAEVTASNEGRGRPGNIQAQARLIRLENRGVLKAQSESGSGGNITLRSQGLLLLRDNSLISGISKGSGAGNININSGFLIGLANSSIIANAENSRANLALLAQGFIFSPDSSVIVNGQEIEFTPNLGIVTELAEAQLVENPKIIDTSCNAIASTDSDTDKSKFTITGRGGLPPSPYEPLSTDVVWSDNRIPNIASQQRTEKPSTKPPTTDDAVKIVPATGWVFDGKGHVTLVSHASSANNLGSTPACQKK
jgi:large exoprotein involved in heme utilization and adhesion